MPLQTLNRHGLAWNRANDCWLVPYKSSKGNVQNLTRYWTADGRKLSLPMLPLRLYGLDTLQQRSSTLFVCEGPFDAIALDQHLTNNKTRNRYDILAVPGAGSSTGFGCRTSKAEPSGWFSTTTGPDAMVKSESSSSSGTTGLIAG